MASLISCKDCGHDVSKNAQSCPNCGAPIKKQSLSRMGCGTLVLIGIFGFMLWSTMRPTYDSPTPAQNVSSPAQPSASPVTTGENVTHYALVKMTESERARSLGRIVDSADDSCSGAHHSFFQGFDNDKGAHWNITCADGAKYNIQIAADVDGSTVILDCGVLAAVSDVECYIPYDKQ